MTISDIDPAGSAATGELLDGRYLLESRIGAGGMGIVYLARDEALGRTVAVKVFREATADSVRSGTETRLLASLNHPSLVTLFDAQTAADRTNYLVMEYVEGATLSERVASGPIGRHDAAMMARDLAEALHVVHQAGIVHRDIKPSNVLLRRSHVPGEEFRAKLADFGIAYLVDSTRLTTPGTLLGTAAYLSPEQVRGEAPAPASDVYALGLVLLEALTGERAFPQAGAPAAALARLSRDPVVPGELGYPWKSLLTGMTSRDPADRPSALDIVVRANALLRDDTVLSEPVGAPTQALDLATEVLDAAPTATRVRGAAPTATPARDADPTATRVLEPVAPSDRRRRRPLVVVLTGVAAGAVLVGLAVWGLAASVVPSGTDSPAQDVGSSTAPLPTSEPAQTGEVTSVTDPAVTNEDSVTPEDTAPAEPATPATDPQPAPDDKGNSGPGDNNGNGNGNGNGSGGGNGPGSGNGKNK